MDGHHSPALPGARSLSLILPAYNEAAGIRTALREADRALAELADDYEIIIVDDGSQDETAQAVADEAQQRPHVRLLRHPENRGYGAALRTGMEAAQFERVAFTDADCQFHLTDLAALVALTEHAPVAVGYRKDRQDAFHRRFFSWGYNVLVRTLLGTQVRDCDCALKVFRKEVVSKLLPETCGFFVNTEILTRAHQLGYEVGEAPVRHRPRLMGTSKVSLSDIPRTLRTLLPFWWSRVLFPAVAQARKHPLPGTAGGTALLLIVAALLLFTRLDCPLQEPEESRYAEIPRQMLSAGNLAVPVLHGLPYYDKPPLLYWLVMASYTALGVHDWTARLVPAASAFSTVLVTYFWGRRVAGPRAGFAAAMILCLSGRFVYLGRLLTMNSLLCLWVVAALAAAHIALQGPRLRWKWWLLSGAACGLGVLTKGPVALVLVCVPVLVYRFLDGRTARLRPTAWSAYLGTACLVAAPWYVCLYATDPEFASYFFWKHNVVRFLAPFDHEKPVYFYLADLLLGMLPWSLLLVPLARFLSRRSPGDGRPAALGFFLLAAVWCFVFFSLAGSKRSGYILPAMPVVALALGTFLDTWLRETWNSSPAVATLSSRFAFRITLALLGIAIVASLLGPSSELLDATWGPLLAGAAGLAFVAVYLLGRNRPPAVVWSMCGTTTFAILFAAVCLSLPHYARRYSLRGQIRPYVERCQDSDVRVVSYPRRWDSVSFYLRRDDVCVYTREERQLLIADLRANPQTLAFIKTDHSLAELLGDLPGSMEFVPHGPQGSVTVGWVRRRMEVPATLLAGRTSDSPR